MRLRAAAGLLALLALSALLGACATPATDDEALRRAQRRAPARMPAQTESPSASPGGSPSPSPQPSPSAPPPAPELHFVAFGDWGSGLAGQYDVAERLCAWRETHPFDLVVTAGDNVYDTGDPDRFAEVLAPYRCLFRRGVRFRATLGNHDVITDGGRPELDERAFGMKARNYVVRKGGVRFVMADSNDLDLSWLRRALTGEPGDRWKIVVMHHPVYSSGSEHGSTPGFRPALPKLFRDKGVDLVLTGHDHNYEVTVPMGGIRYVVTGGGGASIRSCVDGTYFSDVCIPRLHFLWIEADDRTIEVRAIPAAGRAIDRFVTRGVR